MNFNGVFGLQMPNKLGNKVSRITGFPRKQPILGSGSLLLIPTSANFPHFQSGPGAGRLGCREAGQGGEFKVSRAGGLEELLATEEDWVGETGQEGFEDGFGLGADDVFTHFVA